MFGLSLCVVSSALATDGDFSHGYGTQSKAMAGAGAALAVMMFAPNEKVRGSNPLDTAQTIKIEMPQFELEVSNSWGGA